MYEKFSCYLVQTFYLVVNAVDGFVYSIVQWLLFGLQTFNGYYCNRAILAQFIKD